MEKLAIKLAHYISKSMYFDTEKTSVIAYGLIALFQMLTIFLVVSILGILGDFWFEGFLIFSLVGFFRKSTGGAHSSTFTGCLIFSIFCISFMAFVSRYLAYINLPYLFYFVSALTFIVSYILVAKLAPVASPKKPIKNPKKISRLRKQAFITLTIYLILVVILYYMSYLNYRHTGYALSITFSVIWQTFMLTKMGHNFMNKIDRKLVDF